MKDKFFGFLGIESGEESMVSMLLTQSVFLGIFFGAFDISAHSLFLSIFDEKMMARGYVVSGIAGIILTSFYTWLQNRLLFKNFAVINLFTVTLLTLILWITLIISPEKWVVFIVFIMLGPLNILAMLGFWGTTGRLFTLRQGKRLFGLVDAGLIVGIIISCYTIPVLLSLRFESHNILLISVSSVLIATLIQMLIGAKFRLVGGIVEEKSEKSKEKKSVLSVFREDRYTRIMAIFVALSVVTAFFVQYSFMAVTREQYPAEEDMARFLGIFTGSMMIFTLLVKLFVFSYIIRNYGLRTCLAISPVLIAAFTAIAIIIGITMGYTPAATSGFLIFFLLLALGRLFSKSLKDSIESPSFKVIYQTIDEKIRYKIQSMMDGTVNEIAALSSGLLLAGLGMLSFITLIHFSLVLIFIILGWVFISFLLYTEYRKSIRKALETVSQSSSDLNIFNKDSVLKSRFSADLAFRNDYFTIICGDYSPIVRNRNKWYIEKIIEHSGSKHDVNLLAVLKNISLDSTFNDEIHRSSEETIRTLENPEYPVKAETEKSEYARRMLSEGRLPQSSEILRLLRDSSIESKRFAIYMIGKFRLTDMVPEVCQCINIPSLEADATSVLSAFGADAATELMRFFLVSSGNINTCKSILRLLCKAKSKESSEFLFSRLWSNSRQLKETAVHCLIESGFRPSPEEKDKLHQLISEIVGIMTWNLSAKVCLEVNNDIFLQKILNKDISRWKKFLFNVLSITYDSGSINKIKENLESEVVESENFALEMIDIVIDDSIKPKLIALLDVIPDIDKLKNLYQFYPGEVPAYKKLSEDILNRDYNLLSLWTKVSTLRNLPEISGRDITESAAALLFSPEKIIQEEAARLIGRSSMELYESVIKRVPDSIKERLNSIINGETNQKDLIFEKIEFLSGCFKGIPEEELLLLSGTMIFSEDSNNLAELPENCIIWPLPINNKGKEAFISYNQLSRMDQSFNALVNSDYYFLPLSSVEEFRNHFPESSKEILNYIDKNEE